jgi:hypothetical protein
MADPRAGNSQVGAKDVGELQRAAEFRCDPLTRRRRLAEDPHREPADSDGHALAVQIEVDEARRTNVRPRIHLSPTLSATTSETLVSIVLSLVFWLMKR